MPAQGVWIYIGNDDRVIINTPVKFCSDEQGFSACFDVTANMLGGGDGLYFTHFEFVSLGRRYYTVHTDGKVSVSDRFVSEEQFLFYDEKYLAPDWMDGGIMYQIFPDRFAKGSIECKKPNTPYDFDWENGIPEYPASVGDSFPNNTHFGGTLYGVAENIAYLKKLGVSCIYLNPIFRAYSNHKYDTADFMSVDESFGGDDALRHLIEVAHKNGIGVILDGVFNHVGDDSIYFNRYGSHKTVGACDSKDSPYYEWFSFENWPYTYDSWWGIKNLPKCVKCESYRKFITEQVIPKYMDMGIDGWRLDVADELESDFLDEICLAVKSKKPDAVIIGEVWEDASDKVAYGERKRYFRGGQLDSVTNYPIRNAIIDFILSGEGELLVSTVNRLYRHYPVHKQSKLMNFLGSHDTERIATVLGGERDNGYDNHILAHKRMTADERALALLMLKNAYLILASLPGIPCIYYGDELGLEGYHDPFNRRTFPISGFESEESAFFASINRVRSTEPLFLAPVTVAEEIECGIVRIIRRDGEGELTVIANMSDSEYCAELECSMTDVFTGAVYSGSVVLPKKSVAVLKTDYFGA